MSVVVPAAFDRTTCACAKCVACCSEQPGPLAPGDLERIAAHLGRAVRDVLGSFWASPGMVVGNRKTGAVARIGTITPRMRDGRCVFLTAKDRCGIHAVAPFGCAYADTHMAQEAWHERAIWMARAIAEDAEYAAVRRTLSPATSWRPRG